jgi:MarR family 2-MHQ and catechol resistance regulon transcriptional repressor
MSNRPDPPPAQRRALAAFVALARAEGALQRRLTPTIEAHGLTMSRFAVLEALLHLGPLNQRAVGERILRSESNVTTVLTNLEREGLVVRRPDPDDRRARIVHLTRAGRARIQRVFPVHAAELTAQLSVLSARELDQLRRLCRRVMEGPQPSDPDDRA